MSPEEARALTRGVRVYFGDDPQDRGTVRANDGEIVRIRWGRDADDSAHRIANCARVHHWRRGLPRVR